MRQDRGISGDAQRLEQLGWMLFLKIIDDKDKELELIDDDYVSAIPTKFQWRNWAENPEGITGDELLNFIDNYSDKEEERGLFPTLRNLSATNNSRRAALIQEVFEGNNNYMKSGYEMRKVINKLNEIDFNNSDDKHIFGTIYESILQELRDAGNKGEYYTPRAVTQLMTKMTDPKLGEKVLDPAAGTGGFLTAAIDHVKENYVRTPDEFQLLQESISGWELKPVAYVLGLTNLILHDMDVPDYVYTDSLKREYNSITNKDRVDVILANPPFGASIADGVETNFPASLRCRESADLFVVLMMHLLKKNGRAAIVLPDGSITGEGVKQRIREKLLTECNLHTIVRMPQSTFFPATVSTNLLFFEKGKPTNDIWYYEHRLPEGQKSYSKTKPIQFDEFAPLIAWWNNRQESEVAWKVNVKDLKGWDLDIKNPNKVEETSIDSETAFNKHSKLTTSINNELENLLRSTGVYRHPLFEKISRLDKTLFYSKSFLHNLRNGILQNAIQGKLTEEWRKEHPAEEPASELLKRIKLEKQQMIASGKLKKEKPLEPIKPEEIPFEIPESWTWGRGIEVFLPMKSAKPRGEFFKYIDIDSIDNTTCTVKEPKNISVANAPSRASRYTEQGDLLFSMVRPYLRNIAIVPENDCIASSGFFVCHPTKAILSKYCYWLMLSPYVIDGLMNYMKGINSPSINKEHIEHYLFPLPPLSEQQEIVRRIDSIMDAVSSLENQISESERTSEELLKAIVGEVMG